MLTEITLPHYTSLYLNRAINNYIVASLQAGKTKLNAFLVGEITPLNMTPGGLLAVRRENWPEYNIVHRALKNMLVEIGGFEDAVEAQLPFCIRVVTPKMVKDAENRKRPYNTYVAHSDIWSGQPANMMHLWIPILGDFEGIGIEWLEPQEFPKEAMKKFPSYMDEIPRKVAADARIYDVKPTIGYAYKSTGTCLHRTVVKGELGLGRISVDFRYRLTKEGPHKEYVLFNEWLEIGETDCYVDARPAKDFK